jgi:hypothetical protein
MNQMNESFRVLWWNTLLPTKMPKAPPAVANLRNVLSGNRQEPSWARALSMPIKVNPTIPERINQPMVRAQVEFIQMDVSAEGDKTPLASKQLVEGGSGNRRPSAMLA